MDGTGLKHLGQRPFSRNGNSAAIDVKGGKILRIRPLRPEEKYSQDGIKPRRMQKDTKILEPNLSRTAGAWPLAAAWSTHKVIAAEMDMWRKKFPRDLARAAAHRRPVSASGPRARAKT